MNGNTLPRPRAPRIFYLALITCLSFFLTACGGGSSGGNDEPEPLPEQSGEIIIGLTDAEGDFHSYIVDVLSVKLVRQNGAEVETLPLATRVDFAQYTDLTEFLTAATVPTGIYTGASLLLDYSAADIVVEDEMGAGVEANPVDANGNALAQLELRVEFENTDTLRIAPGIPAHITLDFDLAASNTVDLSTSPATVTVDPILIADTILEDPKPHRLRGLLNQVAADQDVFSLFIRPFFRHGGEFGSLRVHSVDDTEYEVDGEFYLGHAGIEAMAQLPERSPVIVLGQLDRGSRRFIASDVVAGSSVPWADQDFISGHVLARSGNELTLARVTRGGGDNRVRHQQFVTVVIGDDTVIKQQGNGGAAVDSQAVSVGQNIRVMGEFSDDLTLDATHGRLWMRYTRLGGSSVTVQPLVMDLHSIGRRSPQAFDFSGTGASEDADPDNYEIDTSSLTLDAINIGEPLSVMGHVRPFGAAPQDFSARTVIALANIPAKLLVNWQGAGTTAPFLNQSEESLVLNLDTDTLGRLHKVLRAGIPTDLLDLNQATTIEATDSGAGLYIIAYNGRTRQYLRFERFVDALSNLLDGSNTVQGISGHGRFEDSTATFTARKMVVRLH